MELTAGLSKEKDEDSCGDDCAFETSKLSLPFTDDETLQSTVEADRQIVAVQTENPTFVEAEYPSDEMMPPSNVILVEPELGAFVPLLERKYGALYEKTNDRAEH